MLAKQLEHMVPRTDLILTKSEAKNAQEEAEAKAKEVCSPRVM
jgi:hypothetical protein